ncbi:MAG: DUF2147 domain-containing protein [Porticoccaceae bacterium]|nr:DUF2147 domain-containing protein [Porticoccaceae bacterium]
MRVLFIFITSLWAITGWAESAADPSGLWNTFDKAGTLQSTVEIKIEDGKLYATVVSIHNQSEENPLCEKCEGDLYGTSVIGLEVINGLTLKKNIWQQGTIFDPQTGGSYKCKVWLEEDVLSVRAYLGFVYQTKFWQRAL